MANLKISVLFVACYLSLVGASINLDDLQLDADVKTVRAVSSALASKKDVSRKDEYGLMDKALIAGPLYGLSALQFAKICNELTAAQLGGGLVSGYLAADLVTGVLHAIGDELPGALPESIENFLINLNILRKTDDGHHQHPTKVLGWSYWHNNRPYHMVAYLFLGASAYTSDPFSSCILLSIALLGANSEFFHVAAHGGLTTRHFLRSI